MPNNVYLTENIAAVLRSVACASEGSAGLALELMECAHGQIDNLEHEELLKVYRQGVRHALVSVGLAFGLHPNGAIAYPVSGNAPKLSELVWTKEMSQ